MNELREKIVNLLWEYRATNLLNGEARNNVADGILSLLHQPAPPNADCLLSGNLPPIPEPPKGGQMKNWIQRIDINVTELENELNAFSKQGYQIYKLWRLGYDKYEIVAFKENVDRCSCGQEWVNHDNRKCEEWHAGAGLVPNAYDLNGNPIKIDIK